MYSELEAQFEKESFSSRDEKDGSIPLLAKTN